HYHFWTREHFREQVLAGAVVEWAGVHGKYYGTLWREVEPFREKGIGVILDIDVRGASQVRLMCPDNASILLRAPSVEVSRQRLETRGTETRESIERRVREAVCEESHAHEYDYEMINDNLDVAVAELHAWVTAQFKRSGHAG